MQRPHWLTDPTARKFWDAHAPALKTQGILTDLTLTSFAVLCQTFSDWKSATETRERNKCFDNYFKLATKYGVVPHISAAKNLTQEVVNSVSELDEFAS